jgi:glycine/D-amino acid oxidase-like deaminating enzyme
MTHTTADIVICGAGIAGIAAAYSLTAQHGVKDVVLVDERPPLSLTSDKSTEAYRNWWPGPGGAMVGLMNRSIDLLEQLARESGNLFNLNRRGYVYATADPARIPELLRAAEETSALGAGPVRVHRGQTPGVSRSAPGATRSGVETPGVSAYQPAPSEGFEGQPSGADLILDRQLIRTHFPYLNEKTVAVLHARRCGWFSAQQLGMYLLERAKERGARVVAGRVESMEMNEGRIAGVRLKGASGPSKIITKNFVNAAGPFLKRAGEMLGVELPVYCELHTKLAFTDHLGVIPSDAPFLIWADPQRVPWTDEEREYLSEAEQTRWMLEEFPSGIHTRPDGPAASPIRLMLWDYHNQPVEPVAEPTFDANFPDVVLRGLSTMIPGLRAYFDRPPKPVVDGGYYTKTRENRPLIGPLPVRGVYVIGALSGYGLMAAPAAGELLAAHVTGSELPPYAKWFSLERYGDPAYQKLLENWGSTGQL